MPKPGRKRKSAPPGGNVAPAAEIAAHASDRAKRNKSGGVAPGVVPVAAPAADPVAVAAAPAASRKQREAAPNNLNEQTDEEKVQDAIDESEASAFWGQFDTPLLAAWVADYERGPARKLYMELSRAGVTGLLITDRIKYQRPKEGSELQVLRQVWRVLTGSVTKDEEAPGMFRQEQSSVVPAGSGAAPAATPLRQLPLYGSAAPSSRLTAASLFDPGSPQSPTPMRRRLETEMPPFAAGALPQQVCCQACGQVQMWTRLAGYVGSFICAECGGYGDEPFSSPANVQRMQAGFMSTPRGRGAAAGHGRVAQLRAHRAGDQA
jgi:hypothetical protein